MKSLFMFSGCKNNRTPLIPNVPVNIVLNLGNPLYTNLNVPGGFVIIPDEGSRGMIVVRVDLENIAAFDLHCTFDVQDPCGKALPDQNGLKISCACCNSEWNLLSGEVIKTPAIYPLHSYRTSFDGQIVRIFN